MFSPFEVLSARKAEITLIIPDLDNASEEKREYEAPGKTGAFFMPLSMHQRYMPCVPITNKTGSILVEKPKTKPWNQFIAYVRDPEGFLVEICTPMG